MKTLYFLTNLRQKVGILNFYSFILFIPSLMLTITEQSVYTANNNKILIDVNTSVKKPIEHKKSL